MYICVRLVYFVFFKQKTAYEMRISDWSSDVCSSDLLGQNQTRARKMKIKDAFRQLTDEEAAKLVDEEAIRAEAIRNAEENGIVFIDEKIGGESGRESVCQYV